MKQITINAALMRMVAVMLLTLGTASASAQYYMNIRTSDGTDVQYLLKDIDSVWFTNSAVPTYEYVDLGLSVKWATCNVGATNAEEFGDYFAWGETETKTEFTWENYKFRESGDSDSNIKLTKYNNKREYGIIDNKETLDLEDDVAYVKWGGNWRMPTKDEQDELRKDCTWTKTTLNGINGFLVTSKKSGFTDRSIFLPAAGGIAGTERTIEQTYNPNREWIGFYWSSSIGGRASILAWYGSFGSFEGVSVHDCNRYIGHTVRPVCP